MAVRAISEWYPHKYSPNQNESAADEEHVPLPALGQAPKPAPI